ncbi:hypothetical protein [Archangium lipolyticum]|uniref:hypothetical protein n=1 Tax=Archangium lipolyticum TaxID=2970465 RepID=UPI00214A853C|nr:hypothetical protein [Archangium lipolyticum]
MAPGQPSSLQMPSFLHGSYASVQQKTRKEGLWCAEQYQKDGTFPAPLRLVEVPPGEVVVAHGVADFQRERPAWRLYMMSNVMNGLSEDMEGQDAFVARDAYEAFFRETAWGALYFAIDSDAPRSAELMALRLRAVLRFWETLQSVRYLFKTLGALLTLEELMLAARDWAMDAWCPEEGASVRMRLETATERMARATREDSIEAVLRQLPRVLTFARDLKHQQVLADPAFQRERLATLDPRTFERVSGACTSDLLGQVYAWDRQLGKQ